MMTQTLIKIGDFQAVAATAYQQGMPKVTGLADGGWVVVWESQSEDMDGLGLFQQRYDVDGNPVGVQTRVNTEISGNQYAAEITALPDGGWVITWIDYIDFREANIFQQRFDALGQPVGESHQVPTVRDRAQLVSDVTFLTDGGWVVTWTSNHVGSNNFDVYQQRFNNEGNPVGEQGRVNEYTSDTQGFSKVTSLPDGGWVNVWSSLGQDGNGYGVFQRRFDAAGEPAGSEEQVNTQTAGGQWEVSVTTLADGGWVVTWESIIPNGRDFAIRQQRFDAAGERVGSEIDVSVTLTYQRTAKVIALQDGGWAVGWFREEADGTFSNYLRVYGADGDPLTDEILLEGMGTYGYDIATLEDGGFIVTAQVKSGDVYQQRFDFGEKPVIRGLPTGSQEVGDNATIQPFEDLTITDNGETVSVEIRFDAADGTLTNLINGGVYSDGLYTISGSIGDVLGALHALTFVPTEHPTKPVGEIRPTNFTIKVSDEEEMSEVVETTIDIKVTNRDPYDLFLVGNHVGENQEAGTVVGTLHGEDLNAGSTFTYKLVLGDGSVADTDGRFQLVTEGGVTKLVTTQAFDADIPLDGRDGEGSFYLVKMRITDNSGGSRTEEHRIYVDNDPSDDNAPPTDLVLVGNHVGENREAETIVGTLQAEDLSANPTLTYKLVLGDGSLADTDGRFRVVTKDGVTKLLTEQRLDADIPLDGRDGEGSFHLVKVRAANAGGGSRTEEYRIYVDNDPSDDNAPPTDTTLSGQTVQELAGAGTIIGSFATKDENAGDTFTYTLLQPDGRFAIQGDRLVVADGVRLDYEQNQTHDVRVRVTDGTGAFLDKVFSVGVLDLATEMTGASDADDVVVAGAGRDRLSGGVGNDKLTGGKGKDILTGGSGKDVFVFDQPLSSKSNVDKITDFKVKDDQFQLARSVFKTLPAGKLKKAMFVNGSTAQDKNDHLLYIREKGQVYYDADGSGSGKAILFATVGKGLRLSFSDFDII